MGKLTSHFSTSEFKVSESFPDIAETMSMTKQDKEMAFLLCATILEPTRNYLNSLENVTVTIEITSGKRSMALYEALKEKGYNPSKTSDHFWSGSKIACDFIANKGALYNKNLTIKSYMFIRDNLAWAYGQLIYYPEKGHVHVSLPTKKNHSEHWVQN